MDSAEDIANRLAQTLSKSHSFLNEGESTKADESLVQKEIDAQLQRILTPSIKKGELKEIINEFRGCTYALEVAELSRLNAATTEFTQENIAKIAFLGMKMAEKCWLLSQKRDVTRTIMNYCIKSIESRLIYTNARSMKTN